MFTSQLTWQILLAAIGVAMPGCDVRTGHRGLDLLINGNPEVQQRSVELQSLIEKEMDLKSELASIRFSNSFKREISEETEAEIAKLQESIADVHEQLERVGKRFGSAARQHDRDLQQAWGVHE